MEAIAPGGSRRTFIKRAMAAVAALVLPALGKPSPSGKKGNQNMASPIRDIQKLGFQWQTSDPFLFCVHHEDFYPKGNGRMGPDAALLKGRNIGQDFEVKDGWRMYHGQRVPGFPEHPHRGFETVTVVRRGRVDHADSLGAAGRYGGGDVQWMTAGKGIQHAEMFPLLHENQDNTLELFQIWLNLPKANKMVEPHFKMLWAENVPTHRENDGKGNNISVTVVAGELGKAKPPAPPPKAWAANPQNALAIWTIKLDPGAEWTLPPAARGLNRTLYFFKGFSLQVAGTDVKPYHSIRVESHLPVSLHNGSGEAEILLLQGKPIDEPVAQYGPFVMNTHAEIEQAFRDYQRTQFGGWPWNRSDPVHPRGKDRFARHANGREETPPG